MTAAVSLFADSRRHLAGELPIEVTTGTLVGRMRQNLAEAKATLDVAILRCRAARASDDIVWAGSRGWIAANDEGAVAMNDYYRARAEVEHWEAYEAWAEAGAHRIDRDYLTRPWRRAAGRHHNSTT